MHIHIHVYTYIYIYILLRTPELRTPDTCHRHSLEMRRVVWQGQRVKENLTDCSSCLHRTVMWCAALPCTMRRA